MPVVWLALAFPKDAVAAGTSVCPRIPWLESSGKGERKGKGEWKLERKGKLKQKKKMRGREREGKEDKHGRHP